MLSSSRGDLQDEHDTVTSLQEDLDNHHQNTNAAAGSLQTLIDDLELITRHLNRLDDVVNRQANVIRGDIMRAMEQVSVHDGNLKEEVQTTYVNFQQRINEIGRRSHSVLAKTTEDSLTELEKFQERIEDLLDDWQLYLLLLLGGILLVGLGFGAYFVYLQRTIIRDRKNV